MFIRDLLLGGVSVLMLGLDLSSVLSGLLSAL